MLLSWVFYKFPQGDEYLVIFAISLVFLIAPFILSMVHVGVLLALNIIFLGFYYVLGALNIVDVFVVMFLFSFISILSFSVKNLAVSFMQYYDGDFSGKQRRYHSMVNDLEAIDRRGRKVENELSRISKLYEITKKLAPALESKELLDALFVFLEDNFKFQTAHLLMCSREKVTRTISKSIGTEDYGEDESEILNYEEIFKYTKNKGFEPFYLDRVDDGATTFKDMNIGSDRFMLFPLFAGEEIRGLLAIEGVSRSSYSRFGILVPQIVLQLRKVELYEQVQELSIVDGLTGVYLRRYLMGRLLEEVDRAERLGLTFSVGMIDVDNFKKCNDTYGHLVGDAVLKKIAERLKHSVREVDMIARYGGEEFCVVLPETTKKLAVTVADRLRKSIEDKNVKAFDEQIKVTVSAGIATYPQDGKNVEALIDKADNALYKAKRKGRNSVCAA